MSGNVAAVSSKMLRLSETINDMVAYTKVTDHVLLKILHSTEPELQEARNILENVECRRLYRFVGQTNPKLGREDVTVSAVYTNVVIFIRVSDIYRLLTAGLCAAVIDGD